MKNLILFFAITITLSTSCTKDTQVVDANDRNEIVSEETLPGVQSAHTIIIISNFSHHDDAFVDAVFTGANFEVGGKFPVGRNMSTKTISTNLGVQTLYVDVKKTGIDKSISVIDSKGMQQCKSITGTGSEIVTFDNVSIDENKPVTVSYNLTTCISIPEPVED